MNRKVIPFDDTTENLETEVALNSSKKDKIGRRISVILKSSPDAKEYLKARHLTIRSPLYNKSIASTLYRAKRKLRGVLTFSKLIKDLVLFGSSPIFLVKKIINKNITSVLEERQITFKSSAEKEKGSRCLFRPDSAFNRIWNMMMFVLLVYVFIGTPWILAFEDMSIPSPGFLIELLVDFMFFIDICVTLNSSYYSEDKLITSRRQIFFNYLTGLLIIDLVSIFPFYTHDPDTESESNSLVRILRMAKMAKIMRASRITKLLKFATNSERFDKFMVKVRKYNGISRLVGGVVVIVLMAHFTACVWVFAARVDAFGPETWVARHRMIDESKFTLYIASMYWAFTVLTTVGFGDITARTDVEMLLCITWMIVGIVFYTLLVGTIASVMTSLHSKKMATNKKLSRLEQLGEEVKLSRQIIKNMKKNALANVAIKKMNENTKIETLNYLSKEFRSRVCMMMNNNAASKIKFFENRNCYFINAIVPCLKYETVPAENYVYKFKDFAEDIFFIVKGRVNYLTDTECFPFKSILGGSYFGAYEIIKNILREFSVLCEIDCVFLTMNRNLYRFMKEHFTSITSCFEKTSLQIHETDKKTKNMFEELLVSLMAKNNSQPNLVNRSPNTIVKNIVTMFSGKKNQLQDPFQYEEACLSPIKPVDVESIHQKINEIEDIIQKIKSNK